MKTNCTYLPYGQTGYFSKIVVDYINANGGLESFYKYPVSTEGILKAIETRKKFPQQREVLVGALRMQYREIDQTSKVSENIQSLLKPSTFTVTTAHQPVIFTGPLYFIYKILQVIKIADSLNEQLRDYHFVPVYYMGSEDADLQELGSATIDGMHYSWETKQTGAVGRMKVDKNLVDLIDHMEGRLGVLKYGNEIVTLFRKFYRVGITIQQATLEIVNHFFGEYGLVVIIGDTPDLKRLFKPVLEKELTDRFSNKAVTNTILELEKHYRVQAAGRELNLFYLIDDKRARIEISDSKFKIPDLGIQFSPDEILTELDRHPERFSPNVILRGALQETILPNVVFVGGGGELAYWLELKGVFEAAEIPYPVLVLRNSFVLLEKKCQLLLDNLGLKPEQLFLSQQEMMRIIVTARTKNRVQLNGELKKLEEIYNEIIDLASGVDATLKGHVAALKARSVQRLEELEKKMLRAEKRKFNAELHQIEKLRNAVLPDKNLQERVENISLYYAKYGRELIDVLLQYSLAMKQQFAILQIAV